MHCLSVLNCQHHSPNPSEAFTSSEIEERHLESFVFGRHLSEAEGWCDVDEGLAHDRFRCARFPGIVEPQHQNKNVSLE